MAIKNVLLGGTYDFRLGEALLSTDLDDTFDAAYNEANDI